jgi:hypothetical protein
MSRLLAVDRIAYFCIAVVMMAAGSVIGGILADHLKWKVCETACEPNITLNAKRGHCQCATPGEGGKVYYVKPKGQEP